MNSLAPPFEIYSAVDGICCKKGKEGIKGSFPSARRADVWVAKFQLCSFLTPALDGYEWSASCSCLFHLGG